MVNYHQLGKKGRTKGRKIYEEKFGIDHVKSVFNNANNKSIYYLLFSKKSRTTETPCRAGWIFSVQRNWNYFLRGRNAFGYQERLTVDNKEGNIFNKTLFNINDYESFANRAAGGYLLTYWWLGNESKFKTSEREKP